MDYSAFRNSSLQGSAVSVNHKALITRALTKYPVDYALFRELLQNSADAQADSATIQFETSQPSFKAAQLHGAPITRLRFTNDGLDFAAEDWARLREIASGNPNEAKIGAFGVGFYSVFELTDEPLVHSGNKIMNFRYQGVQLHYFFTEKTETYQKGTLIDLPYKAVGELPDLVKFIGFLVQSFLLVNLNGINLKIKFGNGEVVDLLQLTKQTQPSSPLAPPPGLQTSSPNKTLKMTRLEKSDIMLSLKYLNVTQMPPLTFSRGLFSFGKQLVSSLMTDSADPEEYTEIKCSLFKVNCFADVHVSSAFRKQMIETLLKPPPKQSVLSLISFSQSEQGEASNQLKSYVLPEDFNDAKIFIGFPTKQSTGLRSHLALNQVIPTMERTAVDMSNKFVKDWNSEMLYMAGVMARCTYEFELRLAKDEPLDLAMETATKVCSRFKFGSSAPDKVIGLYIKAGFWKCTNQTLVPSTKGILPNSSVKMPRGASKFLRITPIVTNEDLSEQLESLNLIENVSNDDIIKDINSSPLNSDLALKFLNWLIKSWASFDEITKVKFCSAFKVLHNGHTYNFNDVRFYLDRSKLPDEEVAAHLPPSCIPSDLGMILGHKELQTLGIRPLDLISWANFRLADIEKTEKLETSARINELSGVLQVISRTWNRLSSKTRAQLIEILQKRKCIPTQNGLQFPRESYIKEIRLFPQLPVVLTSAILPDSWLLEIGVRAAMDMAFVLDALNGNKLRWNNEDLLQYLDENSRTLTRADWNILREGRFFKPRSSSTLCRAKDLFPPDHQLDKLGLPTIALTAWSEQSNQAKVLRVIGLRHYPSIETLFGSLDTPSKHDLALQYFVDNYEKAGYNSSQLSNFEVIPVESESRYVTPSACYYDASIGIFGMTVMKKKFVPHAAKLGVEKSPPISLLLEVVLSDPAKLLSSSGRYEQIMSYFAAHAGELSDDDIRWCKKTKFIPFRNDNKEIEWCRPDSVYLPYKGTDANDEDLMRPLLKTITPSRQSLPFFQILGVSDRPTLIQLVNKVIANPAAVYNLCPTLEHYEAILYQIENKWSTISKFEALVDRMKSSTFLIGKSHKGTSEKVEEFDVALYNASQIVIVDDVVIFNQFKNKIITCPQDDVLEKLYGRLGVPRLSRLLKESIVLGHEIQDEPARQYLEQRVNERLQLHKENTSKAMKNFKHINVALVSRIELKRQLPPHASVKVQTSACMHPVTPNLLMVAPSPSYDWIDIANALAKTVLLKPDQDSVVVLEVQLSSDLIALEKKGYNVQRLRKDDIAVKEKLSKLIIDEKKTNGVQNIPLNRPEESSRSGELSMPGQFPRETVSPRPTPKQTPSLPPSSSASSVSSKDNSKDNSKGDRGLPNSIFSSKNISGGLFSSLKSMASSMATQSQSSQSAPQQHQLASTHQQPENQMQQQRSQQAIQPSAQPGMQQPSLGSPQRVPASIVSALNRGLSSGREFNNSSLNADRHIDPPPSVAPTACVNTETASQLRYVSTLENGVKIYSKNEKCEPAQDEFFLSYTILSLCDVFGYSKKAVHIYREENSNTIAFNYNGSIFFNSCQAMPISNSLDYYYPVMAHELAHNLVLDHGAQHSFYSESYVQHTLDKFMRLRH